MEESILSINLKKYRQENKLTQQELAEMLDVSDKSISKWELGQTYPSKKNMLNIANTLNISVELLLLEELSEESDKNKQQGTKRAPFYMIIALCLFLVAVNFFSLNMIREKDEMINKQAKTLASQTEDLAKNYSYKVVVGISEDTSESVIESWQNRLKHDFEISEWSVLPNETTKDHYISFNVQAKNNIEMDEIYKKIKETIPNRINIESFYLPY